MRGYQYNNLTIEQFSNRRGITLIELIAVIVIVGLSLPLLMLMLQDISYRVGRSEAIAQATFYAQELMEEIKSKKFVDPHDPSYTALGPNGGETYPNYDDVDDFNGYSEDLAGGYTRCVTVDYVELSAGEWVGTCDPSNPADCNPPSCNPADVTDYKRIRVSVNHCFGDSSLVTIVSGY